MQRVFRVETFTAKMNTFVKEVIRRFTVDKSRVSLQPTPKTNGRNVNTLGAASPESKLIDQMRHFLYIHAFLNEVFSILK